MPTVYSDDSDLLENSVYSLSYFITWILTEDLDVANLSIINIDLKSLRAKILSLFSFLSCCHIALTRRAVLILRKGLWRRFILPGLFVELEGKNKCYTLCLKNRVLKYIWNPQNLLRFSFRFTVIQICPWKVVREIFSG